MPQKKKKKTNQTKQQTFLITNAINNVPKQSLFLNLSNILILSLCCLPLPLNLAEYNQNTQVLRTNWNVTSKNNSKTISSTLLIRE